MKIILTSDSDKMEGQVSNMFGRCPFFVVVELEDGEIKSTKFLENESKDQRGGAGMAAAQTVGNEGVDAVITGNVGPNAFDVLNRLGIDVYSAVNSTLNENIKLFGEGELKKATNPTGGAGRGKLRRDNF
ncbi:MAG: NifB/NifX family molybdenum-iron cluster-binding protein [Candidatus Aenigmatarchaeota archaeon]